MLIDNTVIVYLTEVARAWDHNQQNMPLIVFGGKNTRVKGGTFLKVTDGTLADADRRHAATARSTTSGWRCCRSSASTAPCLSGASGALQSTGALPGIFS